MTYDDEDERSASFVSGRGGHVAAFVIGLVVGAGAALLLAPQSGADTRADIVRNARRARRRAARFADDMRERADDVVEKVKVHVDAGREAGKTAARSAREELRRRLADTDLARDGDTE